MNTSIDEPSNIKWENIQYSPIKRLFRKLFAIIFSILIIIGSVAIVMAAKYGENQIQKSFNTSVDCNYVDYKGMEDLKIEILSGVEKNNRVVTHCFCLETFITKQIDGVKNVVVEINGQKIYACNEWLELWLKSEGLKIGIVILVPIINIVLSLALECNYIFIFLYNFFKFITQNLII